MTQKNDIILERAKGGFCPICNKEVPEYIEYKDETVLDNYVQVEYKGQKVTVCKIHDKRKNEEK